MKVGLDFGDMSSARVTWQLCKPYLSYLGNRDAALRVSMILIISALAALIPATEAGRREPAEALHFV